LYTVYANDWKSVDVVRQDWTMKNKLWAGIVCL